MRKLSKKIIIEGKIKLLTGTHIGGTNLSMSIGGIDKQVIRNPLNGRPYIPGSSLKGKLRSLIDLSYGAVFIDPTGFKVKWISSKDIDREPAALLFGTANTDKAEKQRPSRLIVRDGHLENFDELDANSELFNYAEQKTEVCIDRITSAANPRTLERVPAGAIFGLNMVLNIFDGDEHSEEMLFNDVLRGLEMLQDDYIGGHGSRGYGHIKIAVTSLKGRSIDYYLANAEEKKEKEQDFNQRIPAQLKDL